MKNYLRLILATLLVAVWNMGGYSQETVTVWSENWDGQTTSAQPSTVNSSMYSQTKSGTKLFKENLAGGEAPELLLYKVDKWTIKISDLKGCSGTFTLKYRSNKPSSGKQYVSVTANDNDVTFTADATDTKLYTGTFDLDKSASNLTIVFSAIGSNARLDDIVLTGIKAATATPTTISFNSDFDATKTYTFTNGVAPADYAQPTVSVSPADAAGSVKYTSSNTDVVAVDETSGALSFEGKTTYDTEATITAQFVASDGSAYANSNKLTYTVKNVEAQEAKAKLAFSETRVEVKQGEEASFTAPTLTLTDKDGNEVALGDNDIYYESSNAKTVADVDAATGKVSSWIAPGETVITASYLGSNKDYEDLTATYTLAYIEKEKAATTLAFNEGEHSLNLKGTMTVKAVLKANGAEIEGDVKYTSSAADVASVDETTGLVTALKEGTTTITATYDGSINYKTATATYGITVVDPNKKEVQATVFYESFDKLTDKGGNDGLWSGTDPSQTAWQTSTADNSGWTKSSSYVYTANKCIRLGSSSKNGYVTTPALGLSGSATLTFKAASWGTDNAALTLSISGGGTLDETTFNPANSEFNTYTVHITGATADTKITFKSATKRVFLDEIRITEPKLVPAVTLDESADVDATETVLLENDDKLVYLTLNRTVSADYLNPVCLPFDLTAEQVKEVFGVGSVVNEYTSVTGSTMNFTATSTMTANKPYIVKATESFTTKDIPGVTLKLAGKDETKVSFSNADETFVGDFIGAVSKFSFTTADGTELFLGKDGNLYRPESAGQTLKGMRAYFEVFSVGAESSAKVNIGGGTTSIASLMNGEAMTGKVYNLNGQLVGTSLDKLPKGLYIMKGKKYVIK